MQLQAELYPCRRRSERRRPQAMATFGHGLERILVEISDLSMEGLRVSSPVPVLPGTHIWLKMPLLACREAVVVWCDGEQMGCQFSEPLHPMMFETLTRVRSDDQRLMPGRQENGRLVASLDLKPLPRRS
jgi:hypothetical protein